MALQMFETGSLLGSGAYWLATLELHPPVSDFPHLRLQAGAALPRPAFFFLMWVSGIQKELLKLISKAIALD